MNYTGHRTITFNYQQISHVQCDSSFAIVVALFPSCATVIVYFGAAIEKLCSGSCTDVFEVVIFWCVVISLICVCSDILKSYTCKAPQPLHPCKSCIKHSIAPLQ